MSDHADANASGRPQPADLRSEAEFRRWYWTVADLRDIARSRQLPTTGTKATLTERIAAHLAGRDLPRSSAVRRGRIHPPLTDSSVIPPGVILDRQLRDWFEQTIGPDFRSDHHMRAFLRDHPGATLGDAVAHWHATRGTPPPPIGDQFEYNRFVRRWRAAHPGASHADVVRAWQDHRATRRCTMTRRGTTRAARTRRPG